jgi:TonB family protein
MRRNLVASLLLSPLMFTAAAVASTPATDASATTQARPISTGVTPAHIIYSTGVDLPSGTSDRLPNNAEVVLDLSLDKQGNVQDAQIVKSPNPELIEPVLTAVRQFRFSPATLDKQAIPIDMKLTVLLQR